MKYRTIRTAIGSFGDDEPASHLGIDSGYRAERKASIYVLGVDTLTERVIDNSVIRLVGPKVKPKIGYDDLIVDDAALEGRVIGCIYTRTNGTIVVRAAMASEEGGPATIDVRSRDIAESRIRNGDFIELEGSSTLLEFLGIEALIVVEPADCNVSEEDEIGLECLCLAKDAPSPSTIRDAIRWGRAHQRHPARALLVRRHATPRQLIEAFKLGASVLRRQSKIPLGIRAAIILGFLLGAGVTYSDVLWTLAKHPWN